MRLAVVNYLVFGFLLLFASEAKAEYPYKSYEFFGLTGGLNNTFDPTAIQPNEASDLQNVVFSTSGGIERRQGFTPINSVSAGASETATGLFLYKQSNGTRQLLKLSSNGSTDKLFKMDYGLGTTGPNGTWNDVTGSLSLTIANDDLADFATAQDVTYIAYGTGGNSLLKYTGTGNATQLSTLPNASMVEFHKRILWLAGRSNARSRVDFSNLDVPETFTSTDFILVETDDGQNITGLKSFQDCLYVYKTASIWRICGADRDNMNLEQMVRGIGAAGNSSIVVINNKMLFLTSQGDVMVYDGGINVQIISSKIEGTLSNLNLNRLTKAVAIAFDDITGDQDFYLTLSTSGSDTNNLILFYDTLFSAWTKFSGINANTLATYEVGTQQQAIFFSDYAGSTHHYPSGNTDNGTAISAYYASGNLRLDVPTYKDFRFWQVIMRQQSAVQSVTFETRIDFSGTGTTDTIALNGTGAVWDTAVWDDAVYADVATLIRLLRIDKSGDFIQWRISSTGSTPPFLLRGVRLWLEPVDRLGGTQS